jgi:hypothetical protein
MNARSDENPVTQAQGSEPEPLKVPRTAVQAEASRRNGKKSRGPKTKAGKARSAANALRHGILARKIAPIANYDMDDRAYSHLRKQLIREFGPRTMTEFNAVDMLAFDYIKIGRAAQLQEPAPLFHNCPDNRQDVSDAEDEVDIADAVIAYFSGGPAMKCPKAILQVLSSDLILRAGVMIENAVYYKGKLKNGQKLDSDEQALIDLFKQVDAGKLFKWERAAVMKLLSGFTPWDLAHRERWILLLTWWRARLVEDIEYAKEQEIVYLKERNRLRITETVNIPRLALIQKYDAQIQRSIAKRIAFLEGRRRARR